MSGDHSIIDALVLSSQAERPVEGVATAVGYDPEQTRESSDAPATELERMLTPGDRIGRYVLLGRVGAGAIGIVYAAYDPQLDRRVAVKVLRAKQTRGVTATTHHARLLREAQALARVSHANVVAVHDVDTWEGRIYIAMEFVEGQTLREWLKAETRTRAEILAVFEQAGRGLAAAHAAGLIHRDFKPDNVVVATDGRVKVLDFGLARSEQDPGTRSHTPHYAVDHAEIAGIDRSENQLSVELTQAGGIIGTPAYMAPEQHLGLEVTARSDQFAFCVALHEALHGERPFAGDTVAAVALAIHEGRIRAPTSADVPAWLRRVVVRGLASDPGQRHPDLPSLLAALGRNPRARAGRWFAFAAVAAGVVGLAIGLRPTTSDAAPPCTGGDEQMAEIWDPDRRERLIEQFAASKLPYAEHSATRVATLLDDWSGAWIEGRHEACAATTIRGEQSPALMDRRMSCLDRVRREVTAHVDRLLVADADTIERAIEATEALPSPGLCSDTDRLLTNEAPPSPERKQAIEAIEVEVAELSAEGRLRGHGVALDLALALAPKVSALDDPATSMRFFDLLAGLHASAGDHEGEIEGLMTSYAAAERLGDDEARVEFATNLVRAIGYRQADLDGASLWTELATAIVQRVGDPPILRANLKVAIGTVSTRRGEYDLALAELREGMAMLDTNGADRNDRNLALQALAVVLREKGQLDEAGQLLEQYHRDLVAELGPDHPLVATALASLANNAYARTDYPRAVELHEQSLAILAAAFGPDSVRYHDRLNNYAVALAAVGRADEAEATHRKILAFSEQRYGVDDIRVTPSLENLGNVLTASNRFDEARQMLERSLAIKQANYGVDHPSTAMSSLNLGVALYHLGRYDEAEALYRETERVWTDKLGAEHADLGLVMCNMGDLMHARGRHREAVRYQLAALAVFEPAYGLDSADLAWPLTGLGLARLGLGDHAGAQTALDRAAALRVGLDLPPGERARMDFARAQATLPTDPDAARRIAREVAVDAENFAAGDKVAFELWLARHG